MWLVTIHLLLFSAVLLDYIGLISSQPRTLEDLFPRYNGVMPPVEEFTYAGQFRNFKTFLNRSMGFDEAIFLRRDQIIFGWKLRTYIRSPCLLFQSTNSSIIFESNRGNWIILPSNLSRKLGVDRPFDLVVARDAAAARHVLTSNDPVYRRAHLRACREANDQTDILEQEQVLLIRQGRPIEDVIARIKDKYSEAYTREFTLHLHHHGEYSINGHRERQP